MLFMNLINEFNHALKDGLGEINSSSYKLSIWSEDEKIALAHSSKKRRIFLLFLRDRYFSGKTGEEYLNMAISINNKLGCFAVPCQSIESLVRWGGKTQGPVYAYEFKILNDSSAHCKSKEVI